jgi:hypothetical protein
MKFIEEHPKWRRKRKWTVEEVRKIRKKGMEL